ncbi:uncharacterized protein LOC120359297 [Solenopsis invicta]|uniref:uncharacterized protein LOC120359297 n=1 Tax=Solenopsis invicta TaxID=13686 RepID=UPI00193C93A7|nr:uncharacterized protein LOC120359297 [Solenopsis invicta]XP_039312236.1 uncharacterized protein LOC120359297 [Solenopsis invicta]
MVDRALLLSHPQYHKKNLEFCVNTLINNGYPLELIFNKINIRIKKLINTKLNSGVQNLIDVSDSIVERKKYLVFPYLKDVSEKISTSLNKDIIRLGFRCLNKLDKFIKAHKDKNIKTECNNVVYKLNCNDCNASYVGQTKRKLKTRIKEHVNNIKFETAKISVISEHRLQQNHSINWENVKILDFEPNYHKRLISEMIHINEQKNGLTQKTDTELLDDCYNTILNKLVDM